MGCPTKRNVGRQKLLGLAIQCTSEDPATTTFKYLGAVTTKNHSIEGNTAEVNDSDSTSGFTESQVTSSSISFSASGNYVNDGSLNENKTYINELRRYRFNAVNGLMSEDPVVCLQYATYDDTLTGYFNIVSISIEDPDAELSTWSMEFALAPSPTYGPTLVETPEEAE